MSERKPQPPLLQQASEQRLAAEEPARHAPSSPPGRPVGRALARLGKETFLYTLGDFLTQALAVILVPLYTQLLSTAEFGILGIASTVQRVLLPFMGLGLAGALTRFYFDTSDETERRSVMSAIWSGWLVLFVIILPTVLLVGPVLSPFFFSEIAYFPYLQLAIFIAAAKAISAFPMALLRARRQAGWYSFLSVLSFAASLAASIYFVAVLRQGAVGGLRGQLIGYGAVSVIGFLLMIYWVGFHWSRPKLRQALGFGLPLIPHLLASWVLSFSDRWILDGNVTLEEIGLYTLAYQFGLLMSMLLTSLNRAWSPFFYQKMQENGGSRLITRLMTYYAFLIVFLGIGVSLFSQPAIQLFADSDFHSAHRYVPFIVSGHIFLGFYFLISGVIFFSKKTRHLPWVTGTAAVINLFSNLLLIPRFGAQAAAFSTFASYFALFVISFWIAQRLFPLRYEYRRVSIILLLGIIVLAVGYLIEPESIWLMILLRAFTVASFPALLVVSGFFDAREKALLVEWMGKLRGLT